MIILPQGTVVAAALNLPRHLRGDQVGPDQQAEYCDHPDYSKTVKDKLKPVMNAYMEQLAEATDEEHDPPPIKLAKEQLVQISKDLYQLILIKGKEFPGAAISDVIK